MAGDYIDPVLFMLGSLRCVIAVPLIKITMEMATMVGKRKNPTFSFTQDFQNRGLLSIILNTAF
jgi:hypothetical protein